MKTLGLTGGIGSGKSTVARLFDELGAKVVYADEEARRLMQEDPELRDELISAFGEGTFDETGRLNRAYLAGRVFGDDRAVAQLNAMVHPRVKASFPEIRHAAEQSGAPLLVYEAALLVEAGLDERFDALAVVDAPVNVRVSRVTARDNVSEDAVRARMKHQSDPDNVIRIATFVIDNSGNEDTLRPQVEEIFRTLVGGDTNE